MFEQSRLRRRAHERISIFDQCADNAIVFKFAQSIDWKSNVWIGVRAVNIIPHRAAPAIATWVY